MILHASFDLPNWLQFVLTVVGGWLAGVVTALLAFWKRVGRLETRVQATEQTLYGRRGEDGGLVAKTGLADDRIAQALRLLVKICQKLEIEDGL